jgi:exodeoxyribonuclease V gamma subunit
MIVLVPDLEGYRVAIEQVFGAQEPFGKEFLPFAFGDAREKASFVAGAIGTFLQIVQNKEINRPNFFDLLRNPVVQKARGITEGTLAEWEKWILGMNVFRSRESAEISNPHSWNHGIRRLLLYRLMRTPYSFEGIVFHPYGTLESNDDDSLNAFCKSIESLESFIAKFHQKNSPIRQRELFFDFCREWIDAENDPAESSVQKNLFHTLFSVDWQERAGRKELPFEELKILVERALTQTRPGNSEFLLSGISFVKFKPDRALPMKIIYMLGMNANDFPGKFNPSTLDLRTPTEKRQKRWPGDSNPISKNRYAFLCELMSATLKLRISYLGYNAKKDEPLSASSVVEELKTFLENNVLEKGTTWNTRKVTFNEKRAVNDIYSTRSLYQKFLTFEDAAPASAMPVSAKIAGRIPMEIRAQQIQRFLQNPFEFQISTSLHLPEEEEDETRIPFEPIGLNSLFHAILGKRLFHENLSNGTLGESEIQRCEEQGYLPEGPFAERAKSQLRKIVQRQIEKIDTPQEYHAGDPVEWELKKNGYLITKFTGTPEWVRGDASQSITLLSTCSGTPSFRHYLHPFVCTMIIAAKANTRQKFSIWVISGKEGKESESREFEISPAEAAAWLEKIAALAFENRFRINVPVTLVEEYYNEGSLPSREEFLDDLSKESFGKYWPYRSGESALFSEADWSIPETESAFISTITAHASLFKKLFETRSQAKAVQ